MIKRVLLNVIFLSQLLFSCQTEATQHSQTKSPEITQKPAYESENLIVKKLSDHVYQHISYLQTESFGKVACNGMIVVNGKEAIVFDTPTDDAGARELIDYLTDTLHSKLNGVVATHFHADCIGGLAPFHEKGIPSYAENRTLVLLKDKEVAKPQNGFDNSLALKVGNQKVYAQFIGEGHTKDNITGYFPADRTMFGGCLVKEVGAGKGNLEDANVAAWPETIRQIKVKYPEVKTIIPGHGKVGGTELLDFTMMLFEKE
ncbi:subclass B1 metallo-beta-lactamase [Persicitalea sp.]|uniref:subclass B1 metallo-beta-lactamase n=1 Tax=Persicitalea sp. TaxID=3100273 RepID=UPI00359478C5